jgi:hypothetical protein
MAILKRDPVKEEARAARKEERAQSRAEADRQRAEAEWWKTPPGQARAAKLAGRRFFQVQMPIEWTTRVPLLDVHHTSRQDASGLLEAIEAEGWTLMDVGYVFQPTGSVSRDKLLSTGQTEQIAGVIVGVYLFRAAEG